MVYDAIGVWLSFFLFLLCCIRFFLSPRIGFTVPTEYIHQGRTIAYRTVLFFFLFCILLLPSDFAIVKNVRVIKEKTLNIQLVFDVSLSMALQDIQPSRFHAARDSVIFLLSHLQGYNVSLIAFSGKPFVYIPFSTDTDALIEKMQQTVLADFPPTEDFVGTAIGDALLLAIKNLQDESKTFNGMGKGGVIVLLTDGDSNKGNDPFDVIPLLQRLNIPVFTLGIGEGSLSIGKDRFGNDVMGYINDELLKEIAVQTSGHFYKVTKPEDFYTMFSYIADLVKNQEIKKVVYEYFHFNVLLLPGAIISGSILLWMKRKKIEIIKI